MVWLNATECNGSALYLDLFRTERRVGNGEARYAFSGILGDGGFEGEVLVEVGRTVDVVFADAWLDPAALTAFFSRVSRTEVEAALGEACRSLALAAERDEAEHPQPRPARRRKPRHDLVAETIADWG